MYAAEARFRWLAVISASLLGTQRFFVVELRCKRCSLHIGFLSSNVWCDNIVGDFRLGLKADSRVAQIDRDGGSMSLLP